MRGEAVRGLSFSHMKSPESSRLSAELGSAGWSHMTHAWESIFQDLGQRRFHKMPHKLSFLPSPQRRVWRQQERLGWVEKSAPQAAGCPSYFHRFNSFKPPPPWQIHRLCSRFWTNLFFFSSSAVCYKTIFINHCELLTVRIKKVKPASSEIISFIFFYSSMLFLFIWFFFVAF